MHRVLDLYDHPPAYGRVICADEEPCERADSHVSGAERRTDHPDRRGTDGVPADGDWRA
jgi:hypothetical protein